MVVLVGNRFWLILGVFLVSIAFASPSFATTPIQRAPSTSVTSVTSPVAQENCPLTSVCTPSGPRTQSGFAPAVELTLLAAAFSLVLPTLRSRIRPRSLRRLPSEFHLATA
jgi:hypothetical protein